MVLSLVNDILRIIFLENYVMGSPFNLFEKLRSQDLKIKIFDENYKIFDKIPNKL